MPEVLTLTRPETPMGRIVAPVRIDSTQDPAKTIQCDALVDTGSAYMVLPVAWKQRLAPFQSTQSVQVETAAQETAAAELCGPVRIQIEGFRPIYTEVLFLEMRPKGGVYEPLVGYLVLEQSLAAVDMVGHRLIPIRHVDLK